MSEVGGKSILILNYIYYFYYYCSSPASNVSSNELAVVFIIVILALCLNAEIAIILARFYKFSVVLIFGNEKSLEMID
jgi:hypothetical protein